MWFSGYRLQLVGSKLSAERVIYEFTQPISPGWLSQNNFMWVVLEKYLLKEDKCNVILVSYDIKSHQYGSTVVDDSGGITSSLCLRADLQANQKKSLMRCEKHIQTLIWSAIRLYILCCMSQIDMQDESCCYFWTLACSVMPPTILHITQATI